MYVTYNRRRGMRLRDVWYLSSDGVSREYNDYYSVYFKLVQPCIVKERELIANYARVVHFVVPEDGHPGYYYIDYVDELRGNRIVLHDLSGKERIPNHLVYHPYE